MASVGDSVSTDERKGDGGRELQEDAGKTKKQKHSYNYKQTCEKDYPFICRSHKEVNTLNVIHAE